MLKIINCLILTVLKCRLSYRCHGVYLCSNVSSLTVSYKVTKQTHQDSSPGDQTSVIINSKLSGQIKLPAVAVQQMNELNPADRHIPNTTHLDVLTALASLLLPVCTFSNQKTNKLRSTGSDTRWDLTVPHVLTLTPVPLSQTTTFLPWLSIFCSLNPAEAWPSACTPANSRQAQRRAGSNTHNTSGVTPSE